MNTVPIFNHDSPAFNNYPNERAKLRNTVSDLRWYLFRVLERMQISSTPQTAPQMAETIYTTETIFIFTLLRVIAAATPQNANEIAVTTWSRMRGVIDPFLERKTETT